MFLGDDLLAYLVLAIGGALMVGNVMALIRPPKSTSATTTIEADADDASSEGPIADEPAIKRPPIARTVVMIGIGLVATIWSLATFATT